MMHKRATEQLQIEMSSFSQLQFFRVRSVFYPVEGTAGTGAGFRFSFHERVNVFFSPKKAGAFWCNGC
jgi:hypothetical protein